MTSRVFSNHYFYDSSCVRHSFYCISQVSLTLYASCDFLTSLRWSGKSFPAVPQQIEISRETQSPVSGRQCHINMACTVSSSVAGALVFPSWKNHCTFAMMEKPQQPSVHIYFSGCLKSFTFCTQISEGGV